MRSTSPVVAPITFRMAISRRRRCVSKSTIPKTPISAMTTDSSVNSPTTVERRRSLPYSAPSSSPKVRTCNSPGVRRGSVSTMQRRIHSVTEAMSASGAWRT